MKNWIRIIISEENSSLQYTKYEYQDIESNCFEGYKDVLYLEKWNTALQRMDGSVCLTPLSLVELGGPFSLSSYAVFQEL